MSANEIKLHPKVGLSSTLPSKYYVDPEFLAFEKEQLFYKSWQYVGHISQLQNPGDYFTCDVGDESLIITRGLDGSVRALYNVCTHRASRIEEGEGNKKIFQCPYHAWSFHLDGSLNKAPNFKGVECFDHDQYCLRQAKLEIADAFIFVNLDDNAEPLQNTFGTLFEKLKKYNFSSLRVARTYRHVIRANWKLMIDNYLECDHCPIAHPGFVDAIDMSNYQYHLFDRYSFQCGPANKEKSKSYRTKVDLDHLEFEDGGYYWLWPNLMFGFNPGPANLSINRIIPIDPDTTLSLYTTFFRDENVSKEQEEMMKFIQQVRQEDIDLVERVQKGLHSRAYTQGRFSLTESAVHHFHLMIQNFIEPHAEKNQS